MKLCQTIFIKLLLYIIVFLLYAIKVYQKAKKHKHYKRICLPCLDMCTLPGYS